MGRGSDDWVELAQDFADSGRNQLKRIYDRYGSAKHWCRGDSTLHLHYSLTNYPACNASLGDGCAQLQEARTGEQTSEFDDGAALTLRPQFTSDRGP